MGQKNSVTSGDKKNLQPLGTTKLRDLLGEPFGTRQISQSLDKNNQATSQDKKITEPLGTKKRNLSGPKKLRNHSGQTKSRNLWGLKKISQHLKTKKITLSIGPIASTLGKGFKKNPA